MSKVETTVGQKLTSCVIFIIAIAIVSYVLFWIPFTTWYNADHYESKLCDGVKSRVVNTHSSSGKVSTSGSFTEINSVSCGDLKMERYPNGESGDKIVEKLNSKSAWKFHFAKLPTGLFERTKLVVGADGL